jgi:hypothetical protein
LAAEVLNERFPRGDEYIDGGDTTSIGGEAEIEGQLDGGRTRRMVTMFDKSGQSVSEFCRTNDLPPATLSLWRSQQKG